MYKRQLSGDFSEIFSEQFASQFEETMASLMSQNPQVMQQFEKLAEAAESAGRCFIYFGEGDVSVCLLVTVDGEVFVWEGMFVCSSRCVCMWVEVVLEGMFACVCVYVLGKESVVGVTSFDSDEKCESLC